MGSALVRRHLSTLSESGDEKSPSLASGCKHRTFSEHVKRASICRNVGCRMSDKSITVEQLKRLPAIQPGYSPQLPRLSSYSECKLIAKGLSSFINRLKISYTGEGLSIYLIDNIYPGKKNVLTGRKDYPLDSYCCWWSSFVGLSIKFIYLYIEFPLTRGISI